MAGYILWEGPSRIDGEPIVLICTSPSVNEKTGDMCQYYILPRDVHPIDDDVSVCGGCWFRKEKICYINLGHDVNQVWKAYKAGSYDWVSIQDHRALHGKPDRFGAFGDPTTVPVKVWKALHRKGKATGYTQFWRNPKNQAYRQLCMASCHTRLEVAQAKELGWTPYYAFQPGGEIEGVQLCPFYEEGIQCRDCLLCDPSKGITIQAPLHGSKALYWMKRKGLSVGA